MYPDHIALAIAMLSNVMQICIILQLWKLLQEGKCQVKNTPQGQLITAPSSLIMPDMVKLAPSNTDNTQSATIQNYPKIGAKDKEKVGGRGKPGRPLQQPDPAIVMMYENPMLEASNVLPEDSDLSRMIQEGEITILNEGSEQLPESVQETEVVVSVEPKKQRTPKEYKCDICSKVLGSARSLQWHMQGIHAPPSHQCNECGDKYPFPLKQDKCRDCWMPTGHKPRAFRCLSCNRVFKHRFLLMRHRASCVQDAQEIDKEVLEKYMEVEEKETEEAVEATEECPQCKEKFHSRKEMKAHLRQVHPNAVQCSGCGGTFENFTLLKHHKKFCQSVIKLVLEPKTPRQFICQYCGRSFDSSSKLTDHIKGIHLEPSIYCSCGAAFKWRSSLNKHKEKCPHSRPEDGKTPRKPARIKIAGEEHECPYCHVTYRSDSGLRNHIQEKHKQNAAFRCTICCSVFTSRKALIKHRDNCPPKKTPPPRKPKVVTFTCKACKRTFKKKSHLEKHIIGMHLPGKQYQCNLCGMKFRWNGGLGRHRLKCKKNNTQTSSIITEVKNEYVKVQPPTNHDEKQLSVDDKMIAVVTKKDQTKCLPQEEIVLKLENSDNLDGLNLIPVSRSASATASMTALAQGEEMQSLQPETLSVFQEEVGEDGTIDYQMVECAADGSISVGGRTARIIEVLNDADGGMEQAIEVQNQGQEMAYIMGDDVTGQIVTQNTGLVENVGENMEEEVMVFELDGTTIASGVSEGMTELDLNPQLQVLLENAAKIKKI